MPIVVSQSKACETLAPDPMISVPIRWALGIILALGLLFRLIYVAPQELVLGFHANEDALSHLLLTSNLIASGEAESLLPVFTQPGTSNRWIDNLPTAGRFSDSGKLYYTSFPPGGFIFVAGLGTLLGLEWTPYSLRILGILLHLGLAVSIAGVVRELGKRLSTEAGTRDGLALLAFAISLSTFELARSYSFSLWSHHLIQLPLIWIVWLFLRNAIGPTLYGLVIAMPLLEWTGYVANLALALILLIKWMTEREFSLSSKKCFPLPPLVILTLTALVGLGQLSWFSSLLGFEAYVSALFDRGMARGSQLPHLIKIPGAYLISLGFTILMPLYFVLQGQKGVLVGWKSKQAASGEYRHVILALLLLGFPCLENLLLAEHVTTYTFDRLKGCVFFVVLVFTIPLLANHSRTHLRRFALVITGICTMNLIFFCAYSAKRYQTHTDDGEKIMAACSYVKRQIPHQDTVVMNQMVRATLIHYAGRNMLEDSNPIHHPEAYLRQRFDGSKTVHLIFPDKRITVVRPKDGAKVYSIPF